MSKVAHHLHSNLDQMKQIEALESLRKHMIKELCFAPSVRDPLKAEITVHELKQLARAWKLNERRNFWKDHHDKTTLLDALLQHQRDTSINDASGEDKEEGVAEGKRSGDGAETSPHKFKPVSPSSSKPSTPSTKSLLASAVTVPFHNYCGIKYFFREVSPMEIITSSRFILNKAVDIRSSLAVTVNKWRGEDFELRTEATFMGAVDPSKERTLMSHDERSRNPIHTLGKKVSQHRILAWHLAQYSAARDAEKAALSAETLNSFVVVAETADPLTAAYCIIALSNLSSHRPTCARLIEIGLLQKFAALIQVVSNGHAKWAAVLLLHYASCLEDTQDRVYDAGFSFLLQQVTSADTGTRVAVLFTLCNLLPVIDRQAIADHLMLAIKGLVYGDDAAPVARGASKLSEAERHEYVCAVLVNLAVFSNTHNILFSHDITGLLKRLSGSACARSDCSVGLDLLRVIDALLCSHESLSAAAKDAFVSIMTDVITLAPLDRTILQRAFRTVSHISSLPSLIDILCDSATVQTITRAVMDAISANDAEAHRDAAHYLYNITRARPDEFLVRIVTDGAAKALLHLLAIGQQQPTVVRLTMQGLQNLVSNSSNCVALADLCIKQTLDVIDRNEELAACHVLFNISCCEQCEILLYNYSIHLRLLGVLTKSRATESKKVYIRILAQLCHQKACIDEAVENNLLKILADEIGAFQSMEVWDDCLKLLLAVLGHRKATAAETESVLRILRPICVRKAEEKLIVKCSITLAQISQYIERFDSMDPILRTLCAIAPNDEAFLNISIIIYNLSRRSSTVKALLKDDTYLNICVRVVRKGQIPVQLNVSEALCNMAAHPRCADLLKQELLSDLVVVALLRTSGMAIKERCCNAFWNMLSHDSSRLTLVRGPFIWGMMRLCREDSDAIRDNCCRTLYNTSLERRLVPCLRDHSIFAFLHDVTNDSDADFLEKCMPAAHNYLGAIDEPLRQGEVVYIVRLCASVLKRSSSYDAVRSAVIMVYRCVFEAVDVAAAEGMHSGLMEALAGCASWSETEETRTYVALILCQLCSREVFTAAVALAQIGALLDKCYTHDEGAALTESVLYTLILYINRYSPDASAVFEMPVMDRLVVSIFRGTPAESAEVAAEVLKGKEIAPRGRTERSNSIRQLDMAEDRQAQQGAVQAPPPSVLKRSFSILKSKDECSQQTSVCLMLSIYCYCAGEAKKAPERLDMSIIYGLFAMENLTSPLTAKASLKVLEELSQSEGIGCLLFESRVLFKLAKLVDTSRKKSEADMVFACSYACNILRNWSLHHHKLLPLLVAKKGHGLAALINGLLADYDVDDASLFSISVMFHNAANNFRFSQEFELNPLFVLDSLKAINRKTKKEMIVILNKGVMSLILERYSQGLHVDPLFVSDIFLNMRSVEQTERLEEITKVVARATFESKNIAVELSTEVGKPKQRSMEELLAALQIEEGRAEDWAAKSYAQEKVGDSSNHFNQRTAVFTDSVEAPEPVDPQAFGKISMNYDNIDCTKVDIDDINEEEEEEEEEEREEESRRTVAALGSKEEDDKACEMGGSRAERFDQEKSGAHEAGRDRRAAQRPSRGR